MRLGQVVLMAMVALLACSIGPTSASKNEVESTTARIVRNLLSFADVEKKTPSKEERASTGVVPGSEGGRTGAGTTVVTNTNDNGGTITVSVFHNNGLFQRIKKWWLSLFHHQEERASSSVVPGSEGGRTGAGGGVVTTSNPNGGGTVTVTIYSNNGLFQRIKKWWKNLIGRKDAAVATATAAPRRIRQTVFGIPLRRKYHPCFC